LDNINKAGEYLVKKYKLISAQKYDFYRREYDNLIELIAKNIAQNQLDKNVNFTSSNTYNNQIFYSNLVEFLNKTNLKLVEDSE
jgi:hypothetical protein